MSKSYKFSFNLKHKYSVKITGSVKVSASMTPAQVKSFILKEYLNGLHSEFEIENFNLVENNN